MLGQETSALTPYLATLTDGAIPFVPSRIGSYWLNDFDGDTEIDVMSVDHQISEYLPESVSTMQNR